MNFLELNEEYQKDTTITRENIQLKLFESPRLHGKYHKWQYKWKQRLYKKEVELKELYRTKYKYYQRDFEEALNEKEIKWHIDTDSDYLELNRKVKILKTEVEQIVDWCKHCNSLSFFCGNIVRWEKHMNGSE